MIIKIPQWYRWSFTENTWIHFHMVAGGVGAVVGLYLDIHPLTVLAIVAVLAVFWELYEKLIEDILAVYKSRERWLWDTFGDIVGALVIAVLVILGNIIGG